MIIQQKTRRTQRNGVAAVEAAVLLPFLFLLIFAIWEVGQLIHVNEYVNNSVREGARLAATGNYSASNNNVPVSFQVQSAVGNYLKNVGLTIPPNGLLIVVTNETQNLAMAGVATLNPNNSAQVIITASSVASPQDPVLAANQFDILRVDVEYPFSFARWSPNNLFFYTGNNTFVTATTRWNCLRDKAIVVDSTIPSSPLPGG